MRIPCRLPHFVSGSKDGNVASYQDNNGSSLTYGYDGNQELTSATGTLNNSNYSVSYSYDANGNRTMPGYQTGTGNELLSDGTYKYTYDNDGNTTSQTNIATGAVTYYTWDYENRLTEVKVENSQGQVKQDEKFTYDVFGNRIDVSLNGTTQLYTVYDGSNPYMDFNGSGQLTERYLTNPNGLNQFYGQVNASGTLQWFLTDNLGSIRQVVDASGNVLDAITYDPYGNILSQTNATNAPRYLFTGGAHDSITGTYVDGAREDNPVDGRWLSPDPLGLGPDINPYRYSGNNPINNVDPTGLDDNDGIINVGPYGYKIIGSATNQDKYGPELQLGIYFDGKQIAKVWVTAAQWWNIVVNKSTMGILNYYHNHPYHHYPQPGDALFKCTLIPAHKRPRPPHLPTK